MGADFCFALGKYSHASGVQDDNTISWTHIASVNLFIIIRGTDGKIADEKLTLRIVQDNLVHVSHDLVASPRSAY